MLTGKTRYRTSLFGKLILQVQEEYSYVDDYDCPYMFLENRTRWRDAITEDLAELSNIKGGE